MEEATAQVEGQRATAELEQVRQALLTRYVSGNILNMANSALRELTDQADTICRLRGQTDAVADLKRFVDYIDHTMHISPGEVSRIIDFAQGQMARAEAAESQLAVLRKGLEEAADFLEELSLPFPEDAHPNDRWKVADLRERHPAIIAKARALLSLAPEGEENQRLSSAQSYSGSDAQERCHEAPSSGGGEDPRDWDEDDSWIHDSDMEAR